MDDPRQALTLARFLAVAMAAGPLIFAVVAYMITGGGARPLAAAPGLPREVMSYVWVAFALGLAFAALMIWRSALERVTGPLAREQIGRGQLTLGWLSARLLVVWALLEAGALFGVVLFLLLGSDWILWSAVGVLLIGLFLTFPRAQWYRAFPPGPSMDASAAERR